MKQMNIIYIKEETHHFSSRDVMSFLFADEGLMPEKGE